MKFKVKLNFSNTPNLIDKIFKIYFSTEIFHSTTGDSFGAVNAPMAFSFKSILSFTSKVLILRVHLPKAGISNTGEYLYQNDKLTIPYNDDYKDWRILIDSYTENNTLIIEFEATNSKTAKIVSKEISEIK